MCRNPALPSILVALCLPGWSAAQQPAFGPLTSEEGAPIHRISYASTTESADLVGRGAISTDLWLGFSNIFEQDSSATHVLFMDMERLLTTLTVRWGAGSDLELGGRLTLETTGGGLLDPFLLWYHDQFGFGQANRDRFPNGRFEQRLGDGTETLVEGGRRTLGLDEGRLFLKWRATSSSDGRSVLSLKAVGRIPAQSNLVGERKIDVALAALTRLGVGSWYLHGTLGGSTARASPELDPILRRGSAFLSVALERSLGSSLAGIVQYNISSPVLRGFGHRELDWAAGNVLFGLAGRFGEGWSWDVGFQEDVPPDTPAIDFTLGLRVSRTWSRPSGGDRP